MSACTCEHPCHGVYRHCPTAVGHDLFVWQGDYDQEATIDDVKINLGLRDIISITQPADEKDEEDLILVFGRADIKRMRDVLEAVELILMKREKLK